jgi:threonine dehydrogenase-like Zn-dependent dehydrogenase
MEQAAMVEPLSVALHGCHQGKARAGDKAVIFGAGPIGLCTAICLKYLGLENVVMVDMSDYRLAAAERLGAIGFKAGSADLPGFLIGQHGEAELMGMPVPATDIYFEATGAKPVFEQVVNTAMDLVNVLLRELNIVGSMAYPDEFPEVITMLESGKIDVSPVITHHFPLTNFGDALVQARNTGESIKVMIDCQA